MVYNFLLERQVLYYPNLETTTAMAMRSDAYTSGRASSFADEGDY